MENICEKADLLYCQHFSQGPASSKNRDRNQRINYKQELSSLFSGTDSTESTVLGAVDCCIARSS
jgi:hypothetical protein